ncbi:hypothetical protein LBMAG47_03830 [Planctomycetia bacterium]|nr:hypothetical protein LBMAG47_03830 [Planctomycetia bacterium]
MRRSSDPPPRGPHPVPHTITFLPPHTITFLPPHDDPKDKEQTMPKQKTHKGVKKRFRLTANGKVKHRRAGTSHLQVRLTSKRKRNLRGTDVLATPEVGKIREALGKYSY